MSIAAKPFLLGRECFEQIKFISPNIHELRKIADSLRTSPGDKSNLKVENVRTSEDEEHKLFAEIVELCDELQGHIDNIVVTVGSFGVFVQRSRRDAGRDEFFTSNMKYVVGGNGSGFSASCRHYPGKPIEKIVNASGAGDAFTSGFIASMLQHKPEAICVSVGFEAAGCALMSTRAVPKAFFDLRHPCWTTPAAFYVHN